MDRTLMVARAVLLGLLYLASRQQMPPRSS
jgi:hypothetical protein